MEILKHSSISPNELKADIEEYIDGLDDSLSYKELFSSSNSTLLIDLMIGFSTWLNQHYISQRTETYLDYAILKNSVVELAYNRGYLTPPNRSAEVELTLYNPQTNNNASVIQKGDIIGTASSENLLSLDNYSIAPGETKKITATFGTIKEFSTIVSDIQPFSKMTFLVPEGNVAMQFEELKINDEIVPISDDLAAYAGDSSQNLGYYASHGDENSGPTLVNLNDLGDRTGFGDFVLRRSLDQESRIYFGNGQIGWWKPSKYGKYHIQYKVMYFKDGLEKTISNLSTNLGTQGASLFKDDDPNTKQHLAIFDSNIILKHVAISENASYEDIEQIRNIATYYPLDGRITQNRDYETIILKYFQTKILDVMSYNISPDQVVRFLIDDEQFIDNIQTKDDYKRDLTKQIKSLIDSRRAMGIKVNYIVDELWGENSEIFELKASIKDVFKINNVKEIIIKMEEYLNKTYVKKYFRGDHAILDPYELTSELSSLFSITLIADKDNISLNMNQNGDTKFLNEFKLVITNVY